MSHNHKVEINVICHLVHAAVNLASLALVFCTARELHKAAKYRHKMIKRIEERHLEHKKDKK